MRGHGVVTGIYNVRPDFLVKRPIIVLSTIAVAAAIIQILVVAN
jgi:hypothetical protein